MYPNYPTIQANPITKGATRGGPAQIHPSSEMGEKVYHILATWVPVQNTQGPQRTSSLHNRTTPGTPTLRQALPEQTRPREGNPILPPYFFQFRYSTSYSMNLTHCSKNLALNQWPQHRNLKERAERGPKVGCIHLTQSRTDLHLKMALGRDPSPINGIIGGPWAVVILQSLSILCYEPPPIRSRNLEGRGGILLWRPIF